MHEQDLAFDPRRGRSVRRALRASIVTLRPRQWVKNALVVAAAGAAGALHHDDVPVRVTLASVAFCLLASGIYAINDVHDAPEDRMHPRKRRRPVAAGDLDPRFAVGLGGVLMCAGLTLCALVRPALALVGLGYVGLTISYTLLWRRVILLDIAAVAGGFVLRALAGGVAAHVGLSRYFVLVVTCGAVFVAAGKRRAELQRSDPGAGDRRQVLHRYRESWLRATLIGSATVALLGYCVWAFELPSVNGVPWRPLTIAPMFVALVRYGMLIRGGEGEAPDELLFGDWLLLIAGICWLVLFALAVHAAG